MKKSFLFQYQTFSFKFCSYLYLYLSLINASCFPSFNFYNFNRIISSHCKLLDNILYRILNYIFHSVLKLFIPSISNDETLISFFTISANVNEYHVVPE